MSREGVTTILVVEDSEADRELYRRLLKKTAREYLIHETCAMEEAIKLYGEVRPDCVLLDFKLPGFTGLEFFAQLKQEYPKDSIPVVFLTGGGNELLVAEVMKAGAKDYLPKDSVCKQSLPRAIESAIERAKREVEAREESSNMQAALERAEKMSTAKHEFLSTMSHEIRNPLNGIVASLEILSKSSDLQREKEYVDLAKVSAEHLWGLITDVLDLSKIEAGQIKLEKVPFSVQQEVYESVKICRAQADLKGICMTVDVDDGVAPLVEGDAFRLRQVLLNLLGNAIKFTPTEGRVSLSVELLEAPSSDEEVVLKFRVSDSGIGISEEQKRVIFQEYQQATGSIAGEFGGTGLGLSIAAKLIELMGGEISVESEMNVGTTFCFVVNFLPAESKRESSVPAASRPEDVPQLSILLAEDNRVNQRLMQSVLERRGHQVTIAENGEEAVSRFEREEFDLIFMDVRMPVLCGMEATARIRAKEKPRGTHVPIVALTAQALPGDREKLLREGMDGYLSKPVRQSDLFQAIAQVVKNQGETLGGGNVRHGLKSS